MSEFNWPPLNEFFLALSHLEPRSIARATPTRNKLMFYVMRCSFSSQPSSLCLAETFPAHADVSVSSARLLCVSGGCLRRTQAEAHSRAKATEKYIFSSLWSEGSRVIHHGGEGPWLQTVILMASKQVFMVHRKERNRQRSNYFSLFFFVFSINAFSLDFFFWWMALQAFNCTRPCWLANNFSLSLTANSQTNRRREKPLAFSQSVRTPHSSHMFRRHMKTSHIRRFNSSSFESKDRSPPDEFQQKTRN